jgi:hypothetical protein
MRYMLLHFYRNPKPNNNHVVTILRLGILLINASTEWILKAYLPNKEMGCGAGLHLGFISLTLDAPSR